MRRRAVPRILVALAALALRGPAPGCFVAGAAIDAGFKDLTDHGKHPLYENKSYGQHFVDSLFESDEPRGEVEVEVHTRRRRR